MQKVFISLNSKAAGCVTADGLKIVSCPMLNTAAGLMSYQPGSAGLRKG